MEPDKKEDLELQQPVAVAGLDNVADDNKFSGDKKKGSAVRSKGIEVAWKDVQLEVPLRNADGSFKILKGVSGVARPGKVLSIMGPSGAGKTSLVELLAHRAVPTGGEITFNGRRWSDGMARIVAYCHQLELFRRNLTVFEHLYINARLRMDAATTAEEINERVEEVMNRLGLLKSRDTIIGAPGLGGISGGERKRLNVATEILNHPSIIVLDEPTSGLDSFLAASMMSMLKGISKGHGTSSAAVTVITIIHQPSSELFMEMEDLLLLANGRTAYFGDSKGLAHYSESVLKKKIPTFVNPADRFMNMISVYPEAVEESKLAIEATCDAWMVSENKDRLINIVKNAQDLKTASSRVDPEPHVQVGKWIQLKVLLWRELLDRMRNKFISVSILIRTLVFYTFVGSLFFRLGKNASQEDVQNVVGALFFIMINQALTFVIPTVQTFPNELVIFRREHSAGIYSIPPYYFSKWLANIPLDLISSIIFTPIIFYMIGFNDSDGTVIGGFIGILILETLLATALGYWVSCMAPTADLALVLAIVFVIFPLIPSGFIIRFDAIPVWYIWMSNASPFAWFFRLFMINQWADYGDIGCSKIDTEDGRCSEDGTRRLFKDGRAVLSEFSIDPDTDAQTATIILICLTFAYHAAAVTVLTLRAKLGFRSSLSK